MTVKDVCENIWYIEKKYDLFHTKIQGIYFWKLVRFRIFNEITNKKGIYGKAHAQLKESFIDRILIFPKLLFNTYFNSVHSRNSNRDILVFESGRKQKRNNRYVDIYINDFINEIKSTNKNYEIIDKAYLRTHFNKSDKRRSYAESLTFSIFFKKVFKKIKLKDFELDLIKDLNREISNKSSIDINIHPITVQIILEFIILKKLYYRTLKKRKVKEVYLVCSYGNEALISACQDLGIKVTEFQHGTMSKYHLGYSYPNNSSIPYFPDDFFAFGQFWIDDTPIPLKPVNMTIKGFSYLKEQTELFNSIKRVKKQILVISQGVIGKKLGEIIYDFAKDHPEYNIFYKLHPGEYNRWKEDYPVLNSAIKLDNFHIIDNNLKNLYEYMYQSEFLIGVFSTVIYEALYVKCKTILIDLPGIEYMEFLIKKNIVKCVGDSNAIHECIIEDNFSSTDGSYFFENQIMEN